LGNFHGFELGDLCPFGHPVFAIIGKVAHIGNIAHIAYLIAKVKQIPIYYVKTGKSPAIAQMDIAIDGWAADIHAYVLGGNGCENLFFA
jgi:methenyltetrahydromethanopterin cyclohydrolase